jgi:hypothetical protein
LTLTLTESGELTGRAPKGAAATILLPVSKGFLILLGEVVVDLGVPWNAGGSAGGADKNRMIPTLTEQPAAVLLQVVDSARRFTQ